MMDHDNEARSNDIIAVNTAQFVKSLPEAEPEEEAAAAAADEPVVVGVVEPDPLGEGKPRVSVCIPLAVLEGLPAVGEEDDVTESLTLVEDTPGSKPDEVELPPPVGGAEAWDGFTRAPRPQGIAAPPGCV